MTPLNKLKSGESRTLEFKRELPQNAGKRGNGDNLEEI